MPTNAKGPQNTAAACQHGRRGAKIAKGRWAACAPRKALRCPAACLAVILLLLCSPALAMSSIGEWPSGDLAARGQPFRVTAFDSAATGWSILFYSPSASVTETVEGPAIDLGLQMPMEDAWATLRLMRRDAFGETTVRQKTWLLTSALRILIDSWIRAIEEDDGALRRSDSTTAPGQCKRYLINTFAGAAKGYYLEEYPFKPLSMPAEHNDAGQDGRREGAGWTLPSAASGNPFVEVARFDYAPGMTLRENQQAALAFLSNVQRGDVFQMFGIFSNGIRVTHTALFIRDFDPAEDSLHWADSNFKNTMVSDVRYGYVVAHHSRTLEEICGWLLQ